MRRQYGSIGQRFRSQSDAYRRNDPKIREPCGRGTERQTNSQKFDKTKDILTYMIRHVQPRQKTHQWNK